jgi:hypothetical protein
VDLQHPSGTRHLSDEDFVRAMETQTLGAAAFRHHDHVRLAWIYLRQEGGTDPVPHAAERMRQTIRGFAEHHGAVGKYHETITTAYMRFVAAHLRQTPQIDRFEEFAAVHPELFSPGLVGRYYSESALATASAREGWIDPDLRELP